MKAVILQPAYLPWMGYFGMIDIADVFVFYDDVQFEKQSWQQRNRVKTPRGEAWLTVPIYHDFGQKINEVKINNSLDWRKKHWQSIYQSYAKAPHFLEYQDEIQGIYQKEWEYLGELNIFIIIKLAQLLHVRIPKFLKSSEIKGIEGQKTDRLLPILANLGADEYITGPGTRDYLETEKFRERGIKLYWYEYKHPTYPQIRGEFVPYMSAIDLLFNTGGEAIKYIREGLKDALKLDQAVSK
jgi:hypothetical protein